MLFLTLTQTDATEILLLYTAKDGFTSKYEQCVAEKDLDNPECFRYWVESAIFEECRANDDVTSNLCTKYQGRY